MKYCSGCGVKLNDGDIFCSSCGTKVPNVNPQNGAENQNPSGAYYGQDRNAMKRPLCVSQLVWAIINTAVGTVTVIPAILGIISIVFTVNAQSAFSDYDHDEKLRIAKILNIVATALSAISLVVIVCFLVVVFGFAASAIYW